MQVVLAIDDDTVVLKILEQQLYGKFRIFTEYIPKKGIETAKSLNPDVIILDLNMPQMSGFDVIEELAKDSITADIPIIVLTSVGDREAVKEAIRLGVVDYIVKPHDPQKLIEKIHSTIRYSALRKSRAADENTDAILLSHSSDTVMISFGARPSSKDFLKDARKVFTEFFFKQTAHKSCVIDLRPLRELDENDMKVMDVLFKLFGQRNLSVIAGRHYGIITEQTELPENIYLFISFGDMEQNLRKMKLNSLRKE